MLAGFKPENGKKMEDVAKFLHNASLTKGLHHNNVLRLVGVCAEEGYVPLVLYEWCNNGNLHHYLEQCRLSGQNVNKALYNLPAMHPIHSFISLAIHKLLMYLYVL